MSDSSIPADDLPDPDSQDARRAVIGAARYDGVTSVVGAFEARRTYVEQGDVFRTSSPQAVVLLSYRVGYGGDTLGLYPVQTVDDLRDDWSRPTPDWFSPGDIALPVDEYDVDDIFLEPATLPGDVVDADGIEGMAETRVDDADPRGDDDDSR